MPQADAARSRSSTVLVMRPGVSNVGESGTIPSVDTRPVEGRKPTTPHHAAGMRMDPPVSVPTAVSTSPADTATAHPELDPPGSRWGSSGLTGPPRGWERPVTPHPN